MKKTTASLVLVVHYIVDSHGNAVVSAAPNPLKDQTVTIEGLEDAFNRPLSYTGPATIESVRQFCVANGLHYSNETVEWKFSTSVMKDTDKDDVVFISPYISPEIKGCTVTNPKHL